MPTSKPISSNSSALPPSASNAPIVPLPPNGKEIIGIVAGKGQFPYLVAQMAKKQGFDVVICGFHGNTSAELANEAKAFTMLHLGQVGKLINFFKKQKATRVCFAGAIDKPGAFNIRPDFRALRIFLEARGFGDDALLRTLAKEFEKDGLFIVQAANLVPGLVAPLGLLTRRQPSDEEWEAITYGWPVAREIGKQDIGQCIVLRRKIVVAVECIEGTDATLLRGGELGGRVALKILKPNQDERLDLPAIGLETINSLQKGGCTCLAYQAGKTLFFDREESVRQAEKNGICIIGLPEEGPFMGHTPEEKAMEEKTVEKEEFLAKLQTLALAQS